MGKKIFNKLKQVFTLGKVLGHKANGQGLENLFVEKNLARISKCIGKAPYQA